MNNRPLISQSRKYYWRFYRLVALAVVIMMAVLTGSLLLGDSVRGTLVQRVGERLGKTETIIASGTGFMSDTVIHQSLMAHAQGYLLVDGYVSVDDKLLPVYVWGTDADSLPSGEAMVNEPLRAKLADAAEMVLHLPAHNMVPSGSLFVTQSYATQMRLHVEGVKSVDEGGNLLLKNEQTLPLNVFVSRQYLAEAMELKGKINIILANDVIDQQKLTDVWQPEWSGIHLTDTSLIYDGIFIPHEIVEKCKGIVYFSYLVNDIVSDRDTIPYSFVTAVNEWQGVPLVGQDMILSDYAAKRLHVSVGDSVEMSYFIAKDLKNLDTNSQKLRVKRIVPLTDFMHDSLLTADFPGLSHVEKCTDWDSDLPIKMERVTKADEDFWYAYRQTPKAIVSYEAVREDWSNAFGSATALRFASKPAVSLTSSDAGLLFYHPRAEGLRAAKGGVDFASLFLALGCFIILAAILLMNNPLLEMLTLRSGEVQLYRQFGFSNSDIRNLFFREAFSVIFLASPFGVIAGFLYSALTLWLLAGVWSGATHTEGFALHVQPLTVIVGWLIGLFICTVSLWMVIRNIVKQNENQGDWSMILYGRITRPVPLILLGVTVVLTSVNFLALHSLALFIVCGLLWITTGSFFLGWYIRRKASDHGATRLQLLWQSLYACRKQHQLAYWTLSMGVFTVFAVGLNRPDVRNAGQAMGGWQYYVESRVPIEYNLNNAEARRRLSLDALPDSTVFLQFLRHNQDEASCLNLNKVSNPTVLGVDLRDMEAFGLIPNGQPMSIYLDEEALVWSLMKSVGDTIYYQDGRGETVPVVIAGSYPTGLFHGAAIMSRDNFRSLWPKESGTEVLLMRSSCPEEAADVLATAMSEYGLTVMTVDERLQMFFEVTETYLVIFFTLGALGLLLGIFSLLIIVRKNLTAQQSTIRLYRTMGFAEPVILQMLLRENLLVPLYALVAGATGAVISISANPVGAGPATILISVVVLAVLCLILYYGIQYIIKNTINNKYKFMKRIFFIALCSLVVLAIDAQKVDFRGVNHCGIFPNERNLLKEWPVGGPKKLWVVNDAGKGNSSALVSDGFIYTAGLTEDEQQEQITCYELDGSKVYQIVYGHAWTKSFQETRSTPVIDDDRLYMASNMGELVCLNRADGKILWTVDFWKKYNITPNDQGICEHPLIDGDKVIVTTCGKDFCMAAFNKLTGDVIWETKGFGDAATYFTSRIIEWNGHRQVISGTEMHIFGVDPDTGKMLWNDSQWTADPATKKWLYAMINSPIFYKGKLLVSLGDGYGCTMYEMADDLSSVKLLWKNKELDFYMGGMIELDGVAYGSTGDKHKWAAVEIETGKVRYHEAWTGGKGRGALIMADGMFYMFDERRGTMGLARINPDKLDIVSEFRITDGSGACFSHPTIFDGVLYVRHGPALIAYDIRK